MFELKMKTEQKQSTSIPNIPYKSASELHRDLENILPRLSEVRTNTYTDWMHLATQAGAEWARLTTSSFKSLFTKQNDYIPFKLWSFYNLIIQKDQTACEVLSEYLSSQHSLELTFTHSRHIQEFINSNSIQVANLLVSSLTQPATTSPHTVTQPTSDTVLLQQLLEWLPKLNQKTLSSTRSILAIIAKDNTRRVSLVTSLAGMISAPTAEANASHRSSAAAVAVEAPDTSDFSHIQAGHIQVLLDHILQCYTAEEAIYTNSLGIVFNLVKIFTQPTPYDMKAVIQQILDAVDCNPSFRTQIITNPVLQSALTGILMDELRHQHLDVDTQTILGIQPQALETLFTGVILPHLPSNLHNEAGGNRKEIEAILTWFVSDTQDVQQFLERILELVAKNDAFRHACCQPQNRAAILDILQGLLTQNKPQITGTIIEWETFKSMIDPILEAVLQDTRTRSFGDLQKDIQAVLTFFLPNCTEQFQSVMAIQPYQHAALDNCYLSLAKGWRRLYEYQNLIDRFSELNEAQCSTVETLFKARPANERTPRHLENDIQLARSSMQEVLKDTVQLSQEDIHIISNSYLAKIREQAFDRSDKDSTLYAQVVNHVYKSSK